MTPSSLEKAYFTAEEDSALDGFLAAIYVLRFAEKPEMQTAIHPR
jgi:hypothetical protein